MNTNAPTSPAALASDALPASAPTTRSKASAEVEKIADTARVHPVVAASTPYLRNWRYEKTMASSAPANGTEIDSAFAA